MMTVIMSKEEAIKSIDLCNQKLQELEAWLESGKGKDGSYPPWLPSYIEDERARLEFKRSQAERILEELKVDEVKRRDDYAIVQIDEKAYSWAAIDKKSNAEFWDLVERQVKVAFIEVAAYGGINIIKLNEMVDVKELTQEMIRRIQKQYPEAKYPYVNQDL